MNRSNPYISSINLANLDTLFHKTAIHEAGHAVGIYLGNQAKQLPPVYFQIVVRQSAKQFHGDAVLMQREASIFAKIQGGRLLHSLPPAYDVAIKDFTSAQRLAYQQAFEADIVNFLMGSLAEAHYVALLDGEIFHPGTVPLKALGNYGGLSDLAVINDYLDCWFTDPALREKKLDSLLLEAFRFVTASRNWFAINALAYYILSSHKEYIECEEAIAVIESNLLAMHKQNWRD